MPRQTSANKRQHTRDDINARTTGPQDEDDPVDFVQSSWPVGVHIQDTGMQDRLEIKKIETSKDLIEQPELAAHEMKLIPSRGHSTIINGASGSGKSTLLANYATNPNFYGPSKDRPNGWFDQIFLFSPTANGDDIQRSLKIPKDNVCDDMEMAPQWIETIFRVQKKKLDGGGKAHVVPQYWFIFDDIIGETSLLNDSNFTKCFYMIRHRNGTTTVCTQHFNKLPRVCRQQAGFIHFFAGSQKEVEQIVEDFAPPLYTKKEFRDIVSMATREPYSFLTVCTKVAWAYRFRLNLGQIIVLDRLLSNKVEDTTKSKPSPGSEVSVAPSKADRTPQDLNDAPRKRFRVEAVREAVDTILQFARQQNAKNEQAGRAIRRS